MKKKLFIRLTSFIILIGGAILLNRTWWSIPPRRDVQLDWQEITSQEGRYAVDMPGTPEPRQEVSPPFLIFKVTTAGHELMRNELPAQFSVLYWDIPLPVPQEEVTGFLEDVCQAICAEKKGAVLAMRETHLGGHPGREIQFDFTDRRRYTLRYFCRGYLVKSRIYVLAVVTTREKASQEFVSKYLDSFRLIQP